MNDNADLAALIRNIPDYPKPGIMFRDVSTLLLDGPGFRATIDRLAALVAPDTTLIAGIEARGFIVAAGLSYALGLGKLMLRNLASCRAKRSAPIMRLNMAPTGSRCMSVMFASVRKLCWLTI